MKVRILAALSIAFALLMGSCGTSAGVDLMANIHAAEKPMTPVDPDRAFIDSVGEFSWALIQEATKDKGNIMISPTSAYFALAMTLNGASGTTRDAMLKTMSAEKLTVNAINIACRDWMTMLTNASDKTDLKISNSIWYNIGFTADPVFLKTNADYFTSAMRQINFADNNTVKEINNWVRQATDGKIKGIMNMTNPYDTMYLINAVYFKSMWKKQFSSLKTYQSEFFLESGTTMVSYMNYESETVLLAYNDLKGVLLPFIDTRFAYIAILPPENSNVRDVVRMMNPASFKKLLDSSRLTNLALHLPKFESEYETNLLDSLNNLGMGAALHSGADFSLMDKNRSKTLSITGIRHKTYFKIDENGAEAAAVTGVTMAGISKIEDKSKVVFNRPFLCGIIDTKTGLPLFFGIMDNPAK